MARAPETERILLRRLDADPHPLAQLRASAERRPDHAAIIFLRSADDESPSMTTYADLLREAENVAKSIRKLGLNASDGIAILLPIIPQAVSAQIAATSVALAFPMNLLLNAEALAAQMELANVKLVITIGPHPLLDIRNRVDEAALRMKMHPHVVEVSLNGKREGGMTWEAFCALGAAESDVPSAGAMEAGVLFHTGGTTGNPKLAQLSRRNFASGALQAAAGLGWREDDRVVAGLPLFHVGGAIDVIAALFSVGATVVMPTEFGMRDPAVVAKFWSILERLEATAVGAVPTSLAALAASTRDSATRLDRLRGIMTGGAPIAADLLRRIEKIAGCQVYQLYGMTETAGIVSAQKLGEASSQPCVGRPVPLVRLGVGAPDAAPNPGATGEIFISGPNCFQGYRTRDGFDSGGDWVASGDLGEILRDGTLKIDGRSKDVIIRSGHNIDPRMIEDAATSHPAVVMAAAVAMPDEYAGELPVLFVTKTTGVALKEDELRNYLIQHISDPPARPKDIFIVEQLPLTPFGKVARFRLRQIAVEHLAVRLCSAFAGFKSVECNDTSATCVRLTFAESSHGQELEAMRIFARMGMTADIVHEVEI